MACDPVRVTLFVARRWFLLATWAIATPLLSMAADQGEGEARRNQLCDAHLYLGLSFEALGDAAKARGHITQATGPYRMDHSMGDVAAMHAKPRDGTVEDAGQSQP